MAKVKKIIVKTKSKMTLDKLGEMILGLKTEVGGLKTEVGGIKQEIGSLKTEIGEVKTGLNKLENKFDNYVEFSTEKFHNIESAVGNLQEDVSLLRRNHIEMRSDILHLQAGQTKMIDRWEKVAEKVETVPAFSKEIDTFRTH